MKPTKWKGYYKILLCAVLACVFHSSVYSVPPGYISPYNGFCDENTTKDELIKTYVSDPSVTVGFSVSQLNSITHYVDHVTLFDPSFPFDRSDGVNWSDTWGVCALFNESTPLTYVAGPAFIDELDHMDAWDFLTINGSPDDEFRVVFVAWIDYPSPGEWAGWTLFAKKLSFIKETVQTFVTMHEWGHTNDCRSCPSGTYLYPVSGNIHYAKVGTPPPNQHLNIMAPDVTLNGYDGDYNFKNQDYPLVFPWWNSNRWQENYD